MKIRKWITVEWLKRMGVYKECIDGFERDFGKKALTRDVLKALNKRKYPGDWDIHLCGLNDLFMGYYGNCANTCAVCLPAIKRRMYAALKKKGW